MRPDLLAADLIRKLWQADPTWGSPLIVGGLRKIGIDVAKSTVETYQARRPGPPSPTWRAFLAHHAQDLVSIDFFTVATVRLAHERRRYCPVASR